MKTILITIPNGAVSYALLRTKFLETILSREDLRVALMVPSYRLAYYQKEFGRGERVQIVGAPDPYKKTEDLWQRFLRQSIPSRTIANRQRHALGRKTGFRRWTEFFATRLAWLLGHLKPWRKFLRFLYGFTAHAAFDEILQKLKPDLIFVSTVYDRMDMGVLKAGRAFKIPMVGMVKSWDSITSKCFLGVHPDWLVVQNRMVARDAEKFGDFPRERIFIGGMPQFDFYFRGGIISPREEFLKKLNLNPSARYFLFGGEGLDLFPEECEVLEIIDSMLSDGAFSGRKIVYRPHPNYERCIIGDGGGILTDAPGKRLADTAGGWEFEEEDIRRLVNSIYHADGLITMASTLALEAALFDKPVLGIAFDGSARKDYFQSSRRFYDTNHFAPISRSGGIYVIENKEELRRAMREALDNPSLQKEGRKKIIKEEIVFTDGRSAERIAAMVLSKLD